MDKSKKVIVYSLLIFSFLFTSCGATDSIVSGVNQYSYRYNSGASPQTWSPTDYTMSNEGSVIGYTSIGFYDFIMNQTKDGYDLVCEMAAEFPKDITNSYAGNPIYKVPGDATEGYAWNFILNKNAKWEDGTPITADDYVYGFQQFLNPKMKNYRASSWYDGNLGIANAKEYYNSDKKEFEHVEWDQVGVIKNNDYSITVILAKPTTLFYVELGFTSLPLVKKDLYEANKQKTGSIVKSSYGTSKETYMSYGPYKIESFQADKRMFLTKNENWYGYTDGKHQGQYQTTNIDIQYINKHETALSLFLQGKLSSIGLESSDLELYGNSDFIQYSPQSYTWKITMNSDINTLRAKNENGINHTLLAYKDFRKAIFLSLDRQRYAATVQPQDDPGYGLINYLYVTDPEKGILYRDTPEAKAALSDVYGVASEEDISGYNKKEASKLFQKAYTQCLLDENITKDDIIQFDFHTFDNNENNVKMIEFVQSAINNATVGTELEGKVKINQVIDEDYYDNLKQGAVDMARTAWGGADFDPYGILECYSTEKMKNEYGFSPEKEELTININGENIRKTYYDWYIALCGGEYTTAPVEIKNHILAQNEKGLLETYNMAPLTYSNSCSLNSQRLIQGSNHYINNLVGFGGLRFLTWSLDDAEWDRYCKENNNQLNY